MKISNFPKVNKLINEILSHQKRILGDKMVGLYLYGSLAQGDFNESISDIDLLCAITSGLDKNEFDMLLQMHKDLEMRNKEWIDRIEVQYLSLSGLQTFKTQSTPMASISPGEPFHEVSAGSDWLINWYMVSKNGITVFGLKPELILPPITNEEFVDTVKNQINTWPERITHISKQKGTQAYAILTLSRAYYSVKHKEQVSKIKAAKWMMKQFPTYSSLIQQALEYRQHQLEDTSEDLEMFPLTQKFVQDVVLSI